MALKTFSYFNLWSKDKQGLFLILTFGARTSAAPLSIQMTQPMMLTIPMKRLPAKGTGRISQHCQHQSWCTFFQAYVSF